MSRQSRRQMLAALAAAAPVIACRASDPPAREQPSGEPVRRFRALPTAEGQGAIVHRIFPTRELASLDPFVLLDDFSVSEPAGFPTHPHRGFEAFTYMIDGAFHHKDNLGNDSVIEAGGTQRFTSGRGAYHSEMPAAPGANRGLQLWVNLPRRLKQMLPSYAGDGAARFSVRRAPDSAVRTIVGDGSPVELQTRVRYLDVALASGASLSEEIDEGMTALVYVMSGAVRAAGEVLAAHEGLLPRPGSLSLTALAAARVLVLQGRPHREPIIQRGPFVD